MKPAKSNVKRFLSDLRVCIKKNATVKTENLIYLLNTKIRGWANYYRHICSKKAFSYIDRQIFSALWRWALRRHPNKGGRWIRSKYFRSEQTRNWVFYAKMGYKDKDTSDPYLDLIKANATPIKRHVKIRAIVTPYDPIYHDYLDKRVLSRKSTDKAAKRPSWWLTWWNLITPRDKESKVTGSQLNAALQKA